jgi:hypothetical protein
MAFHGLSCTKSSVDSETTRYRSFAAFPASASLSLIRKTLARALDVASSFPSSADAGLDAFKYPARSLGSVLRPSVDSVAAVASAASWLHADEVEGLFVLSAAALEPLELPGGLDTLEPPALVSSSVISVPFGFARAPGFEQTACPPIGRCFGRLRCKPVRWVVRRLRQEIRRLGVGHA